MAANLQGRLKRLARNAAKDYGLWWRVPRAYRQAAKAPVEGRKVLFVESSLPTMPDSFKALYARFEADPGFDPVFVSLGKHRVSATRYLRNCVALAREAATARIVFLCDASDVVSSFPLRPETRVVQLWHACGAFKRFGMSTADAGFGLSRADIRRHPFYENTSMVTVSSPEVAWAYVEAMCLEGREDIVAPVGVSRTDAFFDGAFHERSFQRLFSEVPEALGKRVVLYAPTYRGDFSCPRAPELPDLALLKEAVGDRFVVLVKQHPMVEARPAIPCCCEDFAFDVSNSLDIDELLVVSDALVTDYSSVVFEFSLFGRPMVFYAPDREAYRADRDFYYDYDAMTPGPVTSTSDELALALARIAQGGDCADAVRVARFRSMFMSSCDGHATERVFDAATAPFGPRDARLAYDRAMRSGKLRRPYVRAARAGLNALYRLCGRRERANEVVFISRQADEASYDFRALAREFEQRGWKTTMHLKRVTRKNIVAYGAHVAREVGLLGRCRVAVIDRYDPVVSLIDFECEAAGPYAETGGAVYDEFPVAPTVLQLWHAFGSFKKFGFQSMGTCEGHAADVFADYRIHRNCSWVACSGQGSRVAFAEAFSVPAERVVALNRPEFDELLAIRRKADAERDIGSAGLAPVRRPRVLMAPTLRKDAASAHPFRDLHDDRSWFEDALDADVTWAFHPLDEGLPAPGNVSESLVECDVLVTDYSSIAYEAYVLGKPVFFYIPDIDAYRIVPGLNSDPLALAPRLCAFDAACLVGLLGAFLADPDSYPLDELERFASSAFDYTSAELDSAVIVPAASRIADFLGIG